jgi:ribosome-associated protein
MKEIHFEIRQQEDFIPLIQLLKATNAVETGGMAQLLVVQGKVRRNGEIETRKRAKIRRGERIETPFVVILTE